MERKETISSLIKKELGVEVAKITEEEKSKGKTVVGDLKMEQIVKIAKAVRDDLLAEDLKTATKQIVGTANSMTGVLIEGKRPKELIEEINEGKWDHLIKD